MKIPWKKLLSAIWSALKPALIAALGGGVVATASGCCSQQTPSSKTQTSAIYAFGLPAVVITHDAKQSADYSGGDKNTAVQENPVQPVFPSSN